MLEFLFLKQDYTGTFRDLYTLAVKTFGLSDELHDVGVKVDVKPVISPYNESGLECSLAPLYFINPYVVVPHLMDGQLLPQTVVTSVIFLYLT